MVGTNYFLFLFHFILFFCYFCRVKISMEVYDTQIQRTTRASSLETTHLATSLKNSTMTISPTITIHETLRASVHLQNLQNMQIVQITITSTTVIITTTIQILPIRDTSAQAASIALLHSHKSNRSLFRS